MNFAEPPSGKKGLPTIGRVEFIVLMSMMSALDAFSIDAMIPALEQISIDLGIVTENHRQFVITSLFFGFAIGVPFYGFVADQFGRRGPVMLGFVIYCIGTLACIFSSSLEILLTGRFLQGFGAAGPYVLSLTIVRDLYKGRDMAQIMSLVMMVFIGVPMIAPLAGQGVMLVAGWRSIFIVLAVFAVVTMTWYWLRMRETLSPCNRQTLSPLGIWRTVVSVMTHRQTLRYLLAMGAIMGALIAYLSTAQQIFQIFYGLGDWFPLIFASIASLFGIGAYLNSRWVHSTGSARLVARSLSAIVFVSVIYLLSGFGDTALPPLWMHLLYVCVVMFCFAFLFGNIPSLALEPMGHIAGSASSLFNSISTILGIGIATIIGSQLRDNGLPLAFGILVTCVIAWLLNRPFATSDRAAE
jgi:DHA1 family bicyclomycin/chloramphenicol resistance-like MFS transporter